MFINLMKNRNDTFNNNDNKLKNKGHCHFIQYDKPKNRGNEGDNNDLKHAKHNIKNDNPNGDDYGDDSHLSDHVGGNHRESTKNTGVKNPIHDQKENNSIIVECFRETETHNHDLPHLTKNQNNIEHNDDDYQKSKKNNDHNPILHGIIICRQ